jgi:hypothetical protein
LGVSNWQWSGKVRPERPYGRVHSGAGEGRVRVPKQETFYKTGRPVNQKEITMSAQEIQAMAQQFAEAFNNKNIKLR